MGVSLGHDFLVDQCGPPSHLVVVGVRMGGLVLVVNTH